MLWHCNFQHFSPSDRLARTDQSYVVQQHPKCYTLSTLDVRESFMPCSTFKCNPWCLWILFKLSSILPTEAVAICKGTQKCRCFVQWVVPAEKIEVFKINDIKNRATKINQAWSLPVVIKRSLDHQQTAKLIELNWRNKKKACQGETEASATIIKGLIFGEKSPYWKFVLFKRGKGGG